MPQNQSATSPPILIVDDDPGQRSLLESFLKSQGFSIVTASSGEAALQALEGAEFGMMISDVRMPGISGIETLRRARETHPVLPVLLVTAYADIRDAVDAMRDGAVNYLEKPIDLDELLSSVGKGLGLAETTVSVSCDGMSLPESVVAQSPLTQQVFQEALLVAPSETRILITGESGAGKEVLSDQIHAWSMRSNGPIVKVNCAAIPEALLESELFGHEKGAFTGASNARVGRFEEANNGTILLDEIAEMSPMLQAKLLRVIQDGTFQRIGSNTERRTNARVLAATNRNLETEVSEGRFREDLYFRLNVIEIYMPPLRERQADIIPLATLFATQFANGRPRFSSSVTACLQIYNWPGNVRELRNAMERACLMARGDMILPEHLPKRVQQANATTDESTAGEPTGSRMEDVERVVILQTLREHDYNRTETARALGISRRALLYKIRRFKEQGHVIEPA